MEASPHCNDSVCKDGLKPVVAVFDFDGTLIDGDSFIILGRAYAGTFGFIAKMFAAAPWLAAWKLGFISNAQAKQRLFLLLYKGLSINIFREIAIDNLSLLKSRVKVDVFDKLSAHIAHGDRVYIVTAGFAEWLEPLFKGMDIKGIIATGVEVTADGVLTGRFSTPNCYGPEKVRRLLEVEPCRDSYTLVAYGDSDGDNDMKAISDVFTRVGSKY